MFSPLSHRDDLANATQGRIQDFGMGGAQVERRRREYRGAVGAEGVRFGEGVSPSPMGVGSGEGAVPSPRKIF